ncbi:GNAT family N-acetyltransferase [Deinococcus sp.]|uniref:GNAT family N-acetyltransferase n=1 Tax=Deinococcus sp. TaxID=47478 RepID=UPI0025E5750B|nr:GNAT family N-acetyltransferase [Deinococcus sp.]
MPQTDHLTYRRLGPDDLPVLIAFMTTETWPFHGIPNLSPEQVQGQAERGTYWGEDVESWLIEEAGLTVGFVRLFDLSDSGALFDLRLRAAARGRGLGTAALRWLSGDLFGAYPHLNRIEAHTLVGNLAMRRALLRTGFVQEAYHRQSWRQGEQLLDSVGYALLRSDWASGTVTPIPSGEPERGV